MSTIGDNYLSLVTLVKDARTIGRLSEGGALRLLEMTFTYSTHGPAPEVPVVEDSMPDDAALAATLGITPAELIDADMAPATKEE